MTFVYGFIAGFFAAVALFTWVDAQTRKPHPDDE